MSIKRPDDWSMNDRLLVKRNRAACLIFVAGSKVPLLRIRDNDNGVFWKDLSISNSFSVFAQWENIILKNRSKNVTCIFSKVKPRRKCFPMFTESLWHSTLNWTSMSLFYFQNRWRDMFVGRFRLVNAHLAPSAWGPLFLLFLLICAISVDERLCGVERKMQVLGGHRQTQRSP